MALEAMLIGWDGATFALLDPLVRKGVMPHLGKALELGSRGELLSIVPALTPPAWTSLLTGRTPGHHGIFDFFQKESASSLHLRPSHSGNIRAETLWDMANRAGRRVTTLNYPVMFPPPPVEGYVISGGWLTLRQLRLACRPAALYDTLRGLDGLDPRELIMDLSEEERAIEGCSRQDMIEFVQKHIRRERQWAKIAFHLLDTDPTELFSVVLDGTDKIQHLCWPVLAAFVRDGTAGQEERNLLDVCLEYYREIDRILGSLLERAAEGANLVLVSDHGFGESRDIFFVNQWLRKMGHLAWKDEQGPMAAGGKSLGMRHLSRHVTEMDWEKTRAFASTPSSNGIHLAPGCAATLPEREREELLEELIGGLAALRSPTTGGPLVRRVWKRREAFPGPYGDLGPDLTLCLWDGGLVSILASEDSVQARDLPVGAHRPEGVFLGVGPAFARDTDARGLSILDVAPTMLHLMKLAVPESLEGRVRPEVLSREFRAGRQAVDWEAPPVCNREETAQDGPELFTEEDEKEIAERLRRLGYVE
ncbi:MAG: alkaline phosphatase family protein [bacterium]